MPSGNNVIWVSNIMTDINFLQVVTCGNVPLESSFQKVSRCVYTSTGLYEYRGWDFKAQFNPLPFYLGTAVLGEELSRRQFSVGSKGGNTELQGEMKAEGIEVPLVTYSVLIGGFAKARDSDELNGSNESTNFVFSLSKVDPGGRNSLSGGGGALLKLFCAQKNDKQVHKLKFLQLYRHLDESGEKVKFSMIEALPDHILHKILHMLPIEESSSEKKPFDSTIGSTGPPRPQFCYHLTLQRYTREAVSSGATCMPEADRYKINVDGSYEWKLLGQLPRVRNLSTCASDLDGKHMKNHVVWKGFYHAEFHLLATHARDARPLLGSRHIYGTPRTESTTPTP
ncbi:putative membrane protein [Acorus calamus]|uniref:Membrane protein n=1 Tax=Acorus calamus TaxID=4465 RepID=A0AAV9CMF3_ACOCL|nr:putative membrane protein [Acorus calamus]